MLQSIKALIGSAIVDPIFLMGSGQSDPTAMFIMFGAIALVFYFMIQRPQAKKAKEQKAFLENLKKGDKIVTIGGIHGRIDKVADDHYMVEIAPNTKVKLDKTVLSAEMTKAANENSGSKPKE